MEPMRLNKFLSDAGVCSRREADRAVERGEVKVNGVKATLGMKVGPEDEVTYKGKPVSARSDDPDDFVLIAVNKPRGVSCTTAKFDKTNIVDYVGYPTRIYPIGRLDKDSEGLILMTDKGELVNKILRGANDHEKEYLVRVDKLVTTEFIEGMRKGVYLEELDRTTKPCFVEKTGKQTFRIILTQGLNRQIRRMCEAFGYHVRSLNRVRIMNIELHETKLGEYRHIRGEELADLLEALENSTDKPFAEMESEE